MKDYLSRPSDCLVVTDNLGELRLRKAKLKVRILGRFGQGIKTDDQLF